MCVNGSKGEWKEERKASKRSRRAKQRVSELFPEVALVDRDVRMATGLGKS